MPGVQALSVQLSRLARSSVYGISRHRMPEIGHMHTDLMGTAGFQPEAQMRISRVFRQHGLVGYGRLAVLCRYRHLFPVGRMSADRRVHRTGRIAEMSHHHRFIFPCKTV